MPTLTEHINLDEFPQTCIEALSLLENAGFEAWLVGGCVRNSLLGLPLSDVDITTSARWQDVKRIFETAGYAVHLTGTKHGTVTVCVGEDAFEITTFRFDGSYSDGRHPDDVEFADKIELDLARRDFTMNAMAYHPVKGLCDPFEGRRDLERGIIRAVGNPRKRFQEDSLRILRACRFMSQLGFQIEHFTLLGMLECKSNMVRLSAERIVHEMDRFLLGDHVHDALMMCVNVLGPIFPELVACKGFNQNTPYHIYNVLEHMAYVVQYSEKKRLNRWAAFFHDIGKPAAYFYRDDGIGHFYGHPYISVEIARSTMSRLKMSPAFADKVIQLVRVHDDLIDDNPRAVKRALARFGGDVDLFAALCDLKRADAMSQAPQCHGRVTLAESLKRTLDEIVASNEPYSIKQLAIDGNDVLELGVEAGPAVGDALRRALDAVIDGTVENEHDALMAFVTAHTK